MDCGRGGGRWRRLRGEGENVKIIRPARDEGVMLAEGARATGDYTRLGETGASGQVVMGLILSLEVVWESDGARKRKVK